MTPTIVLVHSPFVGPSTWTPVADLAGATVPSLVEASTGEAPHVPKQVEAVTAATADVDGPILLVGHSGAGPLLPAIGAALAGRVAGYVFVDAGLPQGGASRLDLVPEPFVDHLQSLRGDDGSLPPWRAWFPGVELPDVPDADRRLPWTLLTEPLPVPPGWPEAPCGYVRLSASYDGDADEAERRGWPTVRLDGHHLSPMTDPGAVLTAIREVAPSAPPC